MNGRPPIREALGGTVQKVERIKAKGRAAGIMADKALARFCHERAMERLFSSEQFEHRLRLKGGMLMCRVENQDPLAGRTTSDMDLHMPFFAGSIEDFRKEVHEVLYRGSFDGCEFTDIEVSGVRGPDNVPGGSIRMWAHYGGTLSRIGLDVTFDLRGYDAELVDERYPGILGDSFTVKREPWEYMVADKLCALVCFGATTSRMRDFYDLYLVITRKGLDLGLVASAWGDALRAFNQEIPQAELDMPALDPEFLEACENQWRKEQDRRRLKEAVPPLPEIGKMLSVFVQKVLDHEPAVHHRSGL